MEWQPMDGSEIATNEIEKKKRRFVQIMNDNHKF